MSEQTARVPLPRGFYTLLASQGASLFGNAIQQIALPLWVYHLTGSVLSTGVAFAVQFVPVVVLAPWVGHIADRYDRRKLMIVCELTAVVIVGLLLLGVRAELLPLVLVCSALTRALHAVTAPAMEAVTIVVVPLPARARSATAEANMFSAVELASPLAGTALAALFGFEFVVLVNMASFIVSAVVLYWLPACPGEPGLRGAARSTWYALRDHTSRLLRWTVAAEGVYFLCWGADAALALLLLEQEFGPALAGTYATAAGAGWLIATNFVTTRFGSRPLVLMALGVLLGPVAATAFVLTVSIGLAAAFLPAVAIGVGNLAVVIGASSIFKQEVAPQTAGRLFAVRRAWLNAMLTFSFIGLPLIAESALGLRATLVTFSIVTCVAVLPLIRQAARTRATVMAQPALAETAAR